MSSTNFCRYCIAISLAVTFASCSGGGPPTAGELKPFDAVCDKANSGKRVAVEGYLRFPESFTGSTSAVLRLYSTNDASGHPIGVQMPIGTAANQMEMPPKQYTDKDLKVHLADGSVAGIETKVRVSGGIYVPLVGQDFSCALENPLVEKAQ